MKMRSSKVLNKLRAGETVSCFKLNTGCHRVADISAAAGFDCLWTDIEHVPNDMAIIEKQILAAKIHDVDVVVRVKRGSYSDYIVPLEMDAAGIMVPHIMSLEDAKNVVRMTRFHPIGRRPIDGGNADGAYCGIDTLEYMEQANRERFVIVQIEDPEPVKDIEAIAALEGIDMLFFGPADFSQGIGTPCDWENPLLLETRKKVAEACVKQGKFAGTAGSISNLGELTDMGYRFISIGADVVGLMNYCAQIVSDFSKSKQIAITGLYGGE